MASETLTQRSLGGLQVTKVQERSQHLNMLFYGDSGVGKTRLAGSADAVPSMRPVLLIDIEGGQETLRNCYPRVETVRVRNMNEMNDVYSELYDMKHGFKTVILDSVTEIQQFSMGDIMSRMKIENPDRDEDVPSMREWGKNLIQMRRLTRGFRDLDMHTIFTALNENEKDDVTGRRMMSPLLTGKFSKEIAALLDGVYYYYVKNVVEDDVEVQKRLLLTRKTDTVVAKDRTNSLPMIVENPVMQDLYDILSKATDTETVNI